ncbi:putative nuclease of restriction endonuclease-like (RecB) superfamily [Desulfobotulus alkaliphilus]|uniref:Putative nuclease of restriction endonuclease-like (RecB) superfamily n=1 Tax=Desulfobotulus alkaliphilus TaxID=622671 RepID=A0A562S2R4_9BACT|nr:PDDEXK nuclease domain-containing protein [Desulfobotulus alkaliphilus]TWI75645.1 putative nuclease of restriction endonuclease-like (RecB) superfamily [Desulfobotulus alkaliphilus]
MKKKPHMDTSGPKLGKATEHNEDSERKRRDKGKNTEVILPVPAAPMELPGDYANFLKQVKHRVKTERLKAVLSANVAQILMYWDIGRDILEKQEQSGWGARIIDRLSVDLREAFPEMNGFSVRNLKDMRKFAECWPDREIVQRSAAQIPWRNNQLLLYKVKDMKLRIWYVEQNQKNGWSRDVLSFQIETKLHQRIGQSANNFEATLPPDDSDMAKQIFKDPYLFDFLGTAAIRKEAELENKLIEHLEKFLLELGQGFAFVGRQVPMEVGGDDFYIDLLFYHLKLRCFVVVELKAGKFCPGHVSQLTMYMNIVDDMLRHPDDKPTIGLLLVKDKNHTVVKYALAGNTKPIGVAGWEQQITESLPEDLKPSLPSIEEIEKELDREG